MKYFSPSWQSLQYTCYRLSQKIIKSKYKPDLIVAVARGGLSVSHILSDFLNLPITTFTISSYEDMKQHKVPEITLHLGNKLHNKRILLVDDVSDTGKTFIRGVEYLKELGAEEIKTASPYTKTWTKFIPDFFIKNTDRWIIFPFDMKETIVEMSHIMKKDGKTMLQIKNALKKNHIPELYISKYLI